ncbi:MAG: hypothetical protein JNM59_05215 [Hyphomonadaceae bacterium]|nr:hypothetical protein [Hyphomonadaceae bacterium]
MRFGGTAGDHVLIDATEQEKSALCHFLAQSVVTQQMDVSNAAGSREYFAALRLRLLDQLGSAAPLKLTKPEFLMLLTLANAWRYAFGMGSDDAPCEVSPDIVDAIRAVSNEYLAATEAPP